MRIPTTNDDIGFVRKKYGKFSFWPIHLAIRVLPYMFSDKNTITYLEFLNQYANQKPKYN